MVRITAAFLTLVAALSGAQDYSVLSWEERWELSVHRHEDSIRELYAGHLDRAIALNDAALEAHPSNYDAYLSRWLYLRRKVARDALSESLVVRQIESDLELIEQGDFTADQTNVRNSAYEQLFELTGQTAYRVARRILLEDYLAAAPDNILAKPLLLALASLYSGPEEALASYRRLLQHGEQPPLAHDLFKAISRIATEHPQAISAEDAMENFRGWAQYLADVGLETFFLSELYLAQAEYQLARNDAPGVAQRWLDEARSFQDSGAHLLTDSRMDFLFGEVARARGDEDSARQHYRAAWEMVQPHMADNMYGSELVRLGELIEARLSAHDL